jgi:hypothetical protein
MVPVGAVKHAVDDLKYSQVANTADSTVQGMLAAGVAFGVIQPSEMQDLLTRPASRAEVLFGAGAAITQADVSFALRGVK